MKDMLSKLTVLVEASSVFTNKSDALCDFSGDTESITLTAAGHLYIGFSKAVRSVYFHATTLSTGTRTTTVSYYDGSAWVAADSMDDTKGFTRSGFITWILPEDMHKTTVNALELWWIRIDVSVDTSAMVVQAISGLFSDDNELKKEFPKIMDAGFLLGQTSHVLIHEATRDDIMQRFRNRGVRGRRPDGYYQRMTFWDLTDFQEIRQGATLLALSKILHNVSDSSKDDNWGAKSKEFAKKADLALDLAWTTYDRWGENTETDKPSDTSVVYLRR